MQNLLTVIQKPEWKYSDLRGRAFEELEQRARAKVDIFEALTVLKKEVRGVSQTCRVHAARALAYYYSHRKNHRQLNELLANRFDDVAEACLAILVNPVQRERKPLDIRPLLPAVGLLIAERDYPVLPKALQLLIAVVERGVDVEGMVPTLEKQLGHSYSEVRMLATRVLAGHYLWTENTEAARRLFHHSDLDIQYAAIRMLHALPHTVRLGGSMEKLDALQRVAETLLLRIRALPSTHDAYALHARMEMNHALGWMVARIAERKAVLAKEKDGELLAGETIKPPSRGSHRTYRTIGHPLSQTAYRLSRH